MWVITRITQFLFSSSSPEALWADQKWQTKPDSGRLKLEENALKYRACKEAFQTIRVLARRDQMPLDHFHPTPPSPRDPALECYISSQTSGFSLLPAALGGIQQTFPLLTDLTRGRRVTPRIFKHLYWESPSSWIRASKTYSNQPSTLKLLSVSDFTYKIQIQR